MRTTWILIANASEARLFQAEKNTKNLTLLEEFKHPESREKTLDLISDIGGRYRNPGFAPGGLYQEPTPPKELEAERFAHELAVKLNKGRNLNQFHDLIVIAPPHFQGLLSRFCNSHVKMLITHIFHKDYTKLKPHELPQYLNGKIRQKKAA